MRRKKRKMSSRLPLIAICLLLAGAVWLLLVTTVFVVRDVQVVGAGDVPEAEARRLSEIQLGTRMNAIDVDEVRLNVESDGRLAFVSLERRFPNRVVLTVRPRTMDALMLLAGAGKVLVLDSDGYVVQISNRLPDAVIPYVTGIKAAYYTLGRQLDTADGRCGCMKAVVEALKANGATAYASELNVSDIADLRIITRKGTTVTLGNSEDMEKKIAWMAGALADLEARGENGGILDVSSGKQASYLPPSTETVTYGASAEEEAAEGDQEAQQQPQTQPYQG